MKEFYPYMTSDIESNMFTTMDPKLTCPTLTIMLTKTIKALCEVNIKFEKNLEISGSLHVRSDGEKILTCLIDEESIRPPVGSLLQQRNPPETALAQQSAIMALLTASQQMAANRSPGLASPPVRNYTPAASIQGADMSGRHPETAAAHLLHMSSRNTHNAITPVSHNPPPSLPVQNSSSQEVRNMDLARLPPVNSLIQNREVLLGMLQDKSRNSKQEKQVKVEPQSTSSRNHHHHHHHHNAMYEHKEIKEESPDKNHSHHHNSGGGGGGGAHAVTTSPTQQPSTANGSLPPALPQPIPSLPNLNAFPVLVSAANASWQTSTPPVTHQGGGGGGGKTPRAEAESPPQDPEIVTTINSKGQKKFQCMFCGILLSTKNYLKNHINAVHTKARVYPCEICERYFYSAGALRIHKLRHHWAGSKKHKCSHCLDSFLLPVELRRHLVKKHGDTSGGVTDVEDVKEAQRPTANISMEQLRHMQLQEHLRAQQQLLEHEHNRAAAHLQQQQQQVSEPLELSMRVDEHTEQHHHHHQPEPGEVHNDAAMHSQMTERLYDLTRGGAVAAVDCDVMHVIREEVAQHEVVPHTQAPPTAAMMQQVIVQPEPPPDITHMEVGEMHPNQNEVGIPDDDIEEEEDDDEEEEEEIRDASPREQLHNKQRVQSLAQFTAQQGPAIGIGTNVG